MEQTGTITKRELKNQLLDDMELERQRGITIKAKAVTLRTEYKGEVYELNLIDTPGHVDFQYEVSRSLSCCEGALLLVDAFQGVEAQTVANAYAAIEHDLKIIPVINKIDLTYARVDEVVDEMEQSLGIDGEEVVKCSAKAGIGIEELLTAIIERVPPPKGKPDEQLQAMVFDSHYDDFRGAITYARLMQGTVEKGQKIKLARADATYEAIEIGQFVPKRRPVEKLTAGQVGYLICNIKSLADVHIGDTVVSNSSDAAEPLEGYSEPSRMVYCGLYPSDGQDFKELREALEKLSINDPSFEFAPETSDALGFGFRCGFLGLLHMEIIQQRLEDECDVDLVQTAPNVTYQVLNTKGEEQEIHKPQDVPDPHEIEEFKQPIVRVNFVVPTEQIGQVMKLSQDRRGIQRGTEYLSQTRAMITYDLPLAEVIYDLHDKLKSATRGYGTMDYELLGYEPGEIQSSLEAFRDLVHEDDVQRTFDLVDAHFKDETPFRLEYRLRTKSGEYRWFLGSGLANRDESGHPVQMIGSIMDIHELKMTQEALSAHAALLERSNEDLDHFAYIASHDLRAPLRGMKNVAHWIEEDIGPDTSDDIRKKLSLLVGRVDRMDRLLSDILEYSRAGKRDSAPELIDCNTILKEVIEWVEPPEGFTIVAESPLPEIKVSSTLLQQTFLNLVSNSIKHHDKKIGVVRVTYRDIAEHHEFTIEDDGPGIPPEFQDKIFKMFQTIRRRDEVEGSGIGLAIVKKMIEAYGGTVQVRSPLGERGTAFTFTIPKIP